MSVMMIGTDMGGKGGIASVVGGYFASGIADRLSIHYYPTHRAQSKCGKVFFYWLQLLKIITNMRKYGIVHVHMASKWSYRRKVLPLLFAKMLRKRRVIHLHGGAFDLNYRKSKSTERALIRYTFSIADRVLVLSNKWAKSTSLFCDKTKIVIMPNCVPLVCESSNTYAQKCDFPRRILFLGRIVKEKGVYDLLEAARMLSLDSSQVRFYLCGDGAAVDDLRKQIERLGIEKLVDIPGWVTGHRKQTLLEKAYLFVLPSHREGLPVSILEAMATGTPVISTPVGAIPELIRHGFNGYIVPPDSPHAISDRIQLLLTDPLAWKRISENARNTIRNGFSMIQAENRLSNVYNDLTLCP